MNKNLPANSWRKRVLEQLPLLGHRNWIAIVDSAYPWQTAAGIETIATGSSQLAVAGFVLQAMSKASHIRPTLYLDAELAELREQDIPGIDAYRKGLHQLLRKDEIKALPHERIISMVDKAATTFRVLILKSTLTLPYTSVFLQLDCGYWSAGAELRRRRNLGA